VNLKKNLDLSVELILLTAIKLKGCIFVAFS
jgi:hypothetical protein